MALDRASKVALTIGGIIGIGGFIYWLISNKKKSGTNSGSDSNNAEGRIYAISKLSSSDTFAIYVAPMSITSREVANCSEVKISGRSCTDSGIWWGLDTAGYLPIAPFKKGITIKISGNSSINGTYVIEQVWSPEGIDANSLYSLTLKNDGQWDGQMPKNSGLEPNCKTHCYWFNKPMDIPKFKVK